MIRRTGALVVAIVVVAMSVPLTATASSPFVGEVARIMPGLLSRYQVSQAVLGVVEDGKVVKAMPFGASDPDAVFEVASLSKTATSLAVLRLVEQDDVGLDKPANDYLSRWKLESKRFDVDEVTVRRLLDHTSGLPLGFPSDEPALRPYPGIEKVLGGVDGLLPARLTHKPGTKFEYSNPGYGVLELLIEEVTGTSYPKAMRELVFGPLGMKDTGFQNDPELQPRVVPGRKVDGAVVGPFLRMPRAAGAMLSTARDISRLLVGVLLPKGDGGLLKQSSLDEMRKLEAASKGAFGLSDGGYALGVAQGRLPSGAMFVANQGSHEGYNCLLLGMPAERAGLAVLTNGDSGIGIELELALSWFKTVAGESPKIATTFTTYRRALRGATLLAFVVAVLLLALVVRGRRRGRRAWPGSLRLAPLFLKTIPLVALGAGMIWTLDTGVLTGPIGGIAPARFVSGTYQWLVAALGLALIALGVAATAAPKVKRGAAGQGSGPNSGPPVAV